MSLNVSTFQNQEVAENILMRNKFERDSLSANFEPTLELHLSPPLTRSSCIISHPLRRTLGWTEGGGGLTYTAERARGERESFAQSVMLFIELGRGERDAVARKRMKNERAAWPVWQTPLTSSPSS